MFTLPDTKTDTETDKNNFYPHCRETDTKGSFTLTESERECECESEKNQRTLGRDQRKNV